MTKIVYLLAAGFVFSGIGAVQAETNCNQIRLYAKTGRSEQDIAETMIVDIEQVRKCLNEDAKSPPPTPAAAPK